MMRHPLSLQTLPAACRALRLAAGGLLLCLAALTAAAQQRVDLAGAGELTTLLQDHLDISRHAGDRGMRAEEWQRLFGAAPRQIRDLLATEGYFSPQVTPTLRTEGELRVASFDIVPGAPTLVERVDIRFLGQAAQDARQAARLEALRRSWSLASGMRFRQADWDAAKGALLKGLLERDYPAAHIVHSEAAVDPQAQRVVLSVDIDSGPAFTFGPLQVEGLQRYALEMIERLSPIRPGEPYSQEKLTELQARLQDSGYFRSVFATIEPDPAAAGAVPVRVDVVENPRRRLAMGGGFSTDAGARLQTKWLDRRFLGHDWLLDSEARVDRQSALVAGDLKFPARASGWRPGLGTRFERADIANEITDRFRIDARLSGPLQMDERTWGVSLLTERQRVPGAFINNRQALVGSFIHTRRRVDNLVTPSRGYVAALQLDAGPRGVVNQASLLRASARLHWLLPVADRWQAVVRAQAGQVWGAGREMVPSDLLFRAGGDQSVRGYAYNSLGVAEGGAIVGGRVMAVASAELVYAVTPTVGAAVFRDAGNAADRWQDFALRQGTGIGARWRTPVGTLNLDLAFAHATRQPRLHFSVGYGF